jgi:alpha-galactosidase
MTRVVISKLPALLAALLIIAWTVPATAAPPLKVYILAGQSNMQGHAHVRTIEHLGNDPATAPLRDLMLGEDGQPTVCENVWISSIGNAGGQEERHGRLTAGYGAAGRGPKLGPEFTFGLSMQSLVDQPILIIKTAWGGKSLHTDFRPPSAGPYRFNPQQLENLARRDRDLDQVKAERAAATGRFYRAMIDHVRRVLQDPARVCPAYDPQAGYELGGFVWFQGWNDMVDSGTYPNRGQPGGYDAYSDVLAHLIRDVRKDLSAPALPFVIGVMGVNGPIDQYGPDQQRYKGIHAEFRKAMAAPAQSPEFRDNVAAVRTEKYWDPQLSELASRWNRVRAKRGELRRDDSLSDQERARRLEQFTAEQFSPEELEAWETGTSNAAYHYLGSAKIIGQIGKAFAEALAELGGSRAG